MAIKGGLLRLTQTLLYILAFCCAAIILGIYSYFLSVLADRNLHIATWEKAVEGMSGIAVIYTIFAVILTCCLAGVSFFAFLGLAIDICLVGSFIAIAVLTRHGASSCKGTVNTPLGTGTASSYSANNSTYNLRLGTACRLNTAVFAVAIIGAFLFLITAGMQIVLAQHHKKEKRYGPGPSNNYTSGSGNRKFWQRKPKETTEKDAELGTYGAGVAPAALSPVHNDIRPSHETGYTGSTAAAADMPYDKVETRTEPAVPTSYDEVETGTHGTVPNINSVPSSYYLHGQSEGTGINPYGYEGNNYSTRAAGAATNY